MSNELNPTVALALGEATKTWTAQHSLTGESITVIYNVITGKSVYLDCSGKKWYGNCELLS